MKLEKINNDKIKCILDLEELENRHIEVEKLKYGSTETKALFKDIIDRAYNELGFDINGVPLMIEAVPLSNGEIMLIVTKVSPNEKQANPSNNMDLENYIFEKANPDEVNNISLNQAELSNGFFTVCLNNFEDIGLLAKNINVDFLEKSALFFDAQNEKYYLYLKVNENLGLDLNSIYSRISEFSSEPIKSHKYNYLNEKFTVIEPENALCKFSELDI